MWVIALACSPAAPGVFEPGFFAELNELPERTRVATYGTAHLSEGGAALADSPFSTSTLHEPLVVVEFEDQVRVHWQDPQIELLLWLDRPDLEDVLVERTWARGRSDETGAEFPAGHAVRWEGRRPIAELELSQLVARMPVPSAAVDQVYAPSEPPPAPAPDAWLRSGVTLRDLPGGDPVAETVDHGDGFLVPAAILREADGWALVEAVEDELRVRGWVPREDLGPYATLGVFGCSCGGWSRCGAYGWGGGPRVVLPAGTALLDAGSGELVGRVLTELTVPGAAIDGEVAFPFATPWGEAPLVAAPSQRFDLPLDVDVLEALAAEETEE